jgi:hypothetical protein
MILHVDLSNHYAQKSYSVVALVSVSQANRRDGMLKRGIVITDPLRQQLAGKYSAVRLHSALIFRLLEGLSPKKIILCADVEPIDKVISLICALRDDLVLGRFKPLNDLREELGNSDYRSEADAFASNINRNFNKRRNKRRRKEYFDDGSVIVISEKDKEYDSLVESLEKLKEI